MTRLPGDWMIVRMVRFGRWKPLVSGIFLAGIALVSLNWALGGLPALAYQWHWANASSSPAVVTHTDVSPRGSVWGVWLRVSGQRQEVDVSHGDLFQRLTPGTRVYVKTVGGTVVEVDAFGQVLPAADHLGWLVGLIGIVASATAVALSSKRSTRVALGAIMGGIALVACGLALGIWELAAGTPPPVAAATLVALALAVAGGFAASVRPPRSRQARPLPRVNPGQSTYRSSLQESRPTSNSGAS